MVRKKTKPKRTKLVSDQLRQAIDDCGLTRYRIARETGVSETALSLFYNGQRGLSSKALDALGECLQLTIHLGRKPDPKGK
jgi:transcriptional regulator with XRE-family HTH domain